MTEEVQKQTITLDGKTYVVDDLSQTAKYCLQQLQDVQNQIGVARAKVDQLEMSNKGFMDLLREEVSKPAEPEAE